jgi:hypothetical protein
MLNFILTVPINAVVFLENGVGEPHSLRSLLNNQFRIRATYTSHLLRVAFSTFASQKQKADFLAQFS